MATLQTETTEAAGGPTFEVLTESPPTLKELQEKVQGYVEVLPLKDGTQLCVNEDGMPLQLPLNKKATDISLEVGPYGDPIVGNAVLLKEKARLMPDAE